jgi:outer membrane protein assembly factor BamA
VTYFRLPVIIALAIAVAFVAAPAVAQQDDLFEDEIELLEELDDEKKDELVVAPIPIVNPTFGAGLALGGIYLYQLDEGSQPSFTAAGAAYTDSKSYAFGIGQAAYFKDDAWKIKGGAGVFDFNLRFYGIGRLPGDRGLSIPINQEGWAAGVRGLRRIKGDWYVGLQYWFLRITSTFDTTNLDIDLPPAIQLDSQVAGLGVMIEFDSRDNRFNTTSGRLLNATWSNSEKAIGSDFDFSSGKADYNFYHQLKPGKVLAGRGTLCMTPGDAPFYALCKFGQGVDLRGYFGGRFRDETMATVQAEFRWRFYKKWGVVAFAGVGEVAESWSDYNLDDLLPSAGVGLRFKLSKTTGLNLSVDYAVGQDSDALYFYVGESF